MINVMRCPAGVEWVSDIASLKYVSLIRSRLYGRVVCRSAAKCVLVGLDVIQAVYIGFESVFRGSENICSAV